MKAFKLFLPECHQDESSQYEANHSARALEFDRRPHDPDHDHADGQRDEAHPPGHEIGVIAERLEIMKNVVENLETKMGKIRRA